jgi:transcriptional regulator with XRE-family HTH domain
MSGNDENADRIFSSRLKSARETAGWTQDQLSGRAGLPLSSIAQFETAARKPSFDSFRRIAAALGISADYLLGLTDEPAYIPPAEFVRNLERISGDDRELLEKFVLLLAERNKRNE